MRVLHLEELFDKLHPSLVPCGVVPEVPELRPVPRVRRRVVLDLSICAERVVIYDSGNVVNPHLSRVGGLPRACLLTIRCSALPAKVDAAWERVQRGAVVVCRLRALRGLVLAADDKAVLGRCRCHRREVGQGAKLTLGGVEELIWILHRDHIAQYAVDVVAPWALTHDLLVQDPHDPFEVREPGVRKGGVQVGGRVVQVESHEGRSDGVHARARGLLHLPGNARARRRSLGHSGPLPGGLDARVVLAGGEVRDSVAFGRVLAEAVLAASVARAAPILAVAGTVAVLPAVLGEVVDVQGGIHRHYASVRLLGAPLRDAQALRRVLAAPEAAAGVADAAEVRASSAGLSAGLPTVSAPILHQSQRSVEDLIELLFRGDAGVAILATPGQDAAAFGGIEDITEFAASIALTTELFAEATAVASG
mmetsp:Transcript_93265/g.301663  ORF Transcript_93265/g.301663 Transcript_93265/m.301663 type:complete len:422 (+) Transcript_93265:386-1651(+)